MPANADLRFRERHAHQTVFNAVVSNLAVLGWGNVSASGSQVVNFGTDPFTYVDELPDVNDTPIKVNTLSVTIGAVPQDVLAELGDGLWYTDIPFFFDVFSEKQNISMSIASDVKRLLTRPEHLLYTFVNDYTQNPAVVSAVQMHFEDVVGPERPTASEGSADFRKYWRVVKATARTYFSPSL